VLSRFHRIAAPCAVIALASCAGGGDPLRRDVENLRAELSSVRQQNEELARRVDRLGSRLDSAAKLPRAAGPVSAPAEAAPLVPADLAVVRVAPPRAGRAPPPVPTAVPIGDPDPAQLDALAQGAGHGIAAEAEGELAAARRKTGVDRAHALESFVARYPRHPSADNALVEAARDYAAAGRAEASCELARRVPVDYPAGDAVSAAQELAARCERSRP
jgi:TolA-binding protein